MKPSKEQVREWLKGRVRNREPLPDLDAIRRRLNGALAEIGNCSVLDCSSTASLNRNKSGSRGDDLGRQKGIV